MNNQGDIRNSDWERAQQWERERERELGASSREYGATGREFASTSRDYGSTNSVPHLLRQLTGEVTGLFSKEVSLARAEMRESVRGVKSGIISLASGGVVLLAGAIVLLMAAVYGLATTMSLWLSALIVGGVVSLIGLIMVTSGKKKLDADAFKPERTVNSLKEDRAAVREAIKGDHNEPIH